MEKPQESGLSVAHLNWLESARLLGNLARLEIQSQFEHLIGIAQERRVDVLVLHNVPTMGTVYFVANNAAYKASLALMKSGGGLDKPEGSGKVMEGLLRNGEYPQSSSGILSRRLGVIEHDAARKAVQKVLPSGETSGSKYLLEIDDLADAHIEALLKNPNDAPEVGFLKRRLGYLVKDYFGDTVSAEEMELIFSFLKDVFDSLLTFVPLEGVGAKVGWDTLLKFMKPETAAKKAIVDGIVAESIKKSAISESGAEMVISLMNHIYEMETKVRGASDLFLENGEINPARLGDVSTGIEEVIFAAAETTTALWTGVLHLIGRNPKLFAQMKAEVEDYVAKYGSELKYEAIGEGNIALPTIGRVIAEALSKFAPTPITMRTVVSTVNFAGEQPKAGDTIMFPLGPLTEDVIRTMEDFSVVTLKSLPTFLFGTGNHCPGAESAILEVFNLLFKLCLRVDSIQLTNPQEVKINKGSTAFLSGQNFRIVQSAPRRES